MRKLVQRYLAANFIPPFIMSTVFFVAFLLIFQLFRITRLVINKDVGILLIARLVSNIAVSFLPMAVPLSALFATIYCLNKLSEDSEIVAMRSFGIKKFELFSPFLIVGIVISIGIFFLSDNIIPRSKTNSGNTIIRLSSRGVLSDLTPENFYTEIPGVIIFAEKVKNKGKLLGNVFIQLYNRKSEVERVILAKKGVLIKQKENEWEIPKLRLLLTDGNLIKTGKEEGTIEKIIFREYDFPIFQSNVLPGFVSRDSMKTNADLKDAIKDKISRMNEEKNIPAKEGLRKSLVKTKIEYLTRFNTPFQCIVFIFLGFSLGIKKGRGRNRNIGAIGMGILTSYYVLFFVGLSLSGKGIISPAISVFLPTVLAFFGGLYYYRKLDWYS